MTNKFKTHKKNHVFFVIDESGSMKGRESAVVKVFDNQVKWLAKLSTDMDQETRVSVWLISGHGVKCVTFDTDVLRLPSLEGNYSPNGGTPLLQGVWMAVTDLKRLPEIHGDHAFLGFAITDGMENTSVLPGVGAYHGALGKAAFMSRLLSELPDNWTVAGLVPDMAGKRYAEEFGFPKGNLTIWDINSATGLDDAGEEIKQATQSFYEGRAVGTRGTTSLFTQVAQNVTQAQVEASNLKPLSPDQFMIVPVALASTSSLAYVVPKKSITRKNPNGIKNVEIMPFIQETGRTYVAGNVYYELTKSERWSDEKDIAIVHRVTKKVYRGDEAKALVVKPGATRIKPQPVKGGEYDIFPQSTSVNRHLPLGTRVLIFK